MRQPYYVAGVRGDTLPGSTVDNRLLGYGPGAVSDLVDVGRRVLYRLSGQQPEGHRAADPVMDWAEQRVGQGGYSLWSPDSDVRGRMQDRLRPGLRGRGAPKCNQFVFDAVAAGGRPAGRMGDGRVPSTSDWADQRAQIPGYDVVQGSLQPGDVISNGHHMGIYAPLPDGRPGTISAATPDSPDGGSLGQVVHNSWGFRGNEGTLTVRRATKR